MLVILILSYIIIPYVQQKLLQQMDQLVPSFPETNYDTHISIFSQT